MRHFLLLVVLLLNFGIIAFTQTDSIAPVTWSFTTTNVESGKVIVSMKAVVHEGWKLFSTTASDDEPNTRVILDTSTQSKVIAIDEEGNLKKEKEPLLDGLLVKFFQDQATFRVILDIVPGQKEIAGSIDYMALRGDEIVGPLPAKFRFIIQPDGSLSQATTALKEVSATDTGLKRSAIEVNQPASDCGGTGAENAARSGLLGIFFIGFLGGLVALLTPCVFPMIPLTVSFFTKKSGSRKKGILDASLYGFFILLIYVLLSIPFHFLDSSNPEVLNSISTNVWLNLVFFVIFVVFALSFFGLFEITLPSSIANKADEKSQVGGLVGIFFMALTLALVSFSCTGPILGSLLAGSLSTNGGAMQLTMGMAGFGLALALPFTVFALFPSLLSALPRSGGWLTTVKIVLGFLELALAVKFLSNADLVQHWGILKREVFFAIWIIIGILLSLYLFGILRFPHEGKPKLTKVRLAFGLLVAAFTLYLIPGLTTTKYANRALVSGFPPPLNYSIHGEDAFKGVEANVVNDYQAAVALARKENKPLLIDFTGWACVNCRKMEENVWSDPAIKELIEKNFILVSLYVDDRKLLAKDDQFVQSFPDGSKKNVRTLGDQYATFQNLNFNSVSQPMYAIVSPDEKLLTRPVGYTPDAKKYGAWLECGKREQGKRQ
jgi:thiol:disulfide interchange protein DsbD